MINEKPLQNSGSITQLYILDQRYFHRLTYAADNQYNLEMLTGGELKRVYFTQDTAGYQESRQFDKDGEHYDQQIDFVVPKDRPGLIAGFPQRFGVIYRDANGYWKMVGWDEPFRLEYDFTPGQNFEDRNAFQVSLKRKTRKASRHIVNPYGVDGTPADGGVGDIQR